LSVPYESAKHAEMTPFYVCVQSSRAHFLLETRREIVRPKLQLHFNIYKKTSSSVGIQTLNAKKTPC